VPSALHVKTSVMCFPMARSFVIGLAPLMSTFLFDRTLKFRGLYPCYQSDLASHGMISC
jgi:hypothetical protein